MTDNEINVAIAEACGWEPTTDGGVTWDADGKAIVTPPNYCANLNAMHEAEQALANMNILDRVDLRPDYTNMLWLISAKDGGYPLMATARQRAEAFLRTVGKWRD